MFNVEKKILRGHRIDILKIQKGQYLVEIFDLFSMVHRIQTDPTHRSYRE